MKTFSLQFFRKQGSIGGRKGRKTLTSEQAKKMAAIKQLKNQKTK